MSELPIGILLAAGMSRRFGRNKLLYPVNDNTPMLMLSAQKLVSVLPGSIVVISHELDSYAAELEQLGMYVVVNEHAERGMGSSIATGVRANQNAKSWLIALADMPYIKIETIKQLADRLENGAEIVAPAYQQQRGHPVGFNYKYKNELLALNDDIGARHILLNHKNSLELIDTSDPGVLIDMDQRSDIEKHGTFLHSTPHENH